MLSFCFVFSGKYRSRDDRIAYHEKDKGKARYKGRDGFKYVSGKKTLENGCAKFFFNDAKNMSLKDAADKYMQSLGTEGEDLKTEWMYSFSLKLLDDISGKLQSYHASYKKLGGKYENKSWSFIYDVENDRILALENVLKPEYVRELKEKDYVEGTLSCTATALIWGKKTKNMITLNRMDFADNRNCFTDDFGHFIEEAKQTVALASLARVKEVYDSLAKKPWNREVNPKELRDQVAVVLISDNEKGITDDMLVRQQKYKQYDIEELKVWGEVFFNNSSHRPEVVISDCLNDAIRGKDVVRDLVSGVVFEKVEQFPKFIKEDGNFEKWVLAHLKYPALAEENGIQGCVVCSFYIEPDGTVSDIRILSQNNPDPILGKEATRVLESMPLWIPGKKDGKAVRTQCFFSVKFRLQ